jgi:MFS family permease
MGGKVGSATAFGLGGVVIALAGALGGWRMPLLGPLEPWQIVMTLVGAPGLALAFLALTLREPPRKQNVVLVGDVQGKTRAAMNRFLAANWRLAVLMVASFSCLAICGYSLTAWAPTYIERAFGWTPQQYGPGLSVMNLIAAASLVMNGKIVDHLFSRGMRDAHLRFYSWLMVLIAPVVVLLFMAPNAYVFLGLYCIVQFVTVPYMVYLSSVVALLAPNAVRGQLLAGFLFISTLLGLGAGPAMVGALTDFVFHDESRIGDSLMIVVVGCFALSLATMRWALVYLGPSVTRAEGGLRGGVVT